MFWFSLGTMMSNWEHPSSDYLKKLALVHRYVGATRPFAQPFSYFGRWLNPAPRAEWRRPEPAFSQQGRGETLPGLTLVNVGTRVAQPLSNIFTN